MYSVTVRDHILIAHSLSGNDFGPAQNLHGATYIVDTEFIAERLNANSVVIDIGLASRILSKVCGDLNYKNLDEIEQFKGKTTTAEFLSAYIHGKIRQSVKEYFQGQLKVTLSESHVAKASYEGQV